MEHDPLARLALTFDAHRRAFTRAGLAALGAFLLLFALAFAGSETAFAVMFRLGSLVALPWLPLLWIFWFHPRRGSRGFVGRWYGAFVILVCAAVVLAAPFLL